MRNCKLLLILKLGIFTAFPAIASQSVEACLQEASSKYETSLASAKSLFMDQMDACDQTSPSHYTDVCYRNVGRKFEMTLRNAKIELEADQKACQSVES